MLRRDFLCRTAATALAGAASGAYGAVVAGSAAGQQAAPKAKVRIGMIGTGHAHAAGKLAAIRDLRDDFELIGVVEQDERRRKKLNANAKFANLRWLTEAELLKSPGLQAVAVETSVPQLLAPAGRCVAADLHVHLDKPAGENLAEFVALLKSAQQHGVHVQMGYMLRYNPAFELCFRAVRENWLGPIFEVSGVMSKEADEKTRRELAAYPGGAMFDVGCHLIDALVTVLGAPQKVTPFERRTRPQQDSLADNQLAVFDYSAATATIRSSLVEPEGNKRRQFVVCGENGTLEIRPIEPPKLQLRLKTAAGGYEAGLHEIALPPAAGRFTAQLADFAAVVRGERTARYSAQHDIAVQKAVLAASNLPLGAVTKVER